MHAKPNQGKIISRKIVKTECQRTFKTSSTGALQGDASVLLLDRLDEGDSVNIVIELLPALPGVVGPPLQNTAGQLVKVRGRHFGHFRVPHRTSCEMGDFSTINTKVFLENYRN